MVAIPVLRSRVAPVFNWCSRVILYSIDNSSEMVKEELNLEGVDPFQKLNLLRSKGVTTLVCGALSEDLLVYANCLGLNIIYGVAGEVDQVFDAFCQNRLDEPCFRLPGCRRSRCGWRRYKRKRMSPTGF